MVKSLAHLAAVWITVVLGSDGATIRAQGAMDIEVPFAELEERLSA